MSDDQNYAVFNSRMLVDTVGDVTDEALKASRIKDIIGVLAGRIFNWGQRKSLFPLHAYAASAYIDGFLEPLTNSAPITFCTAAVSKAVLGHKQLEAIPNSPSSSARP